jgi:hypothetical protein
MARPNNWNPQTKIFFEAVRDTEFAEILAELGQLIYIEIRSCQLRNQLNKSIPSNSHEVASPTKMEAANE